MKRPRAIAFLAASDNCHMRTAPLSIKCAQIGMQTSGPRLKVPGAKEIVAANSVPSME
jgi:hypothetical protein